jgi:hypothetical protein
MVIFINRLEILNHKSSIDKKTLDEDILKIINDLNEKVKNRVIISNKNFLRFNNNNFNERNNYLKERPVLFPCNDELKKKIIGFLNKINIDNFDKIVNEIILFLKEYDSLNFTIDTIINVCGNSQTNFSIIFTNLCKILIDKDNTVIDYLTKKILETLKSIDFSDMELCPNTQYDEFCLENKKKSKYINLLQFCNVLHFEKLISPNTLEIILNDIIEIIKNSSISNKKIKIYIESLLSLSKLLKDDKIFINVTFILKEELKNPNKFDFRTKFMIQDILDLYNNNNKIVIPSNKLTIDTKSISSNSLSSLNRSNSFDNYNPINKSKSTNSLRFNNNNYRKKNSNNIIDKKKVSFE